MADRACGPVRLPCLLAAVADEVAEVEDERVGDLVEGRGAFTGDFDGAGFAQDPEVLRGVGLFEAACPVDFADRARTVAQAVQNAQARGIGEDREEVGEAVELLGCRGGHFCFHLLPNSNIMGIVMKILPIFSAAAILGVCVGCHRPEVESAVERGPARSVMTVTAALQPLWDEEEVVGNVEAAQRAVLSAKVTGVIDAVKVAPGARVAQGEELATIDAREIKARLDQALAAQDQAQRDFSRIEQLLKSGSATRQEFDAANTALRTADAGVVEARTMLQYTAIFAPFDGVVTRKLAEVGDLATPGKPILEMENSALLRFEGEVPEALIERVEMGAEMPVRVDAAGADLTGRVSEIAPSASAGSRTFLVKLDLPEAPRLRPGQFGRLRVPVQERPAVVVPTAAVVERGQIEGVFVVADGVARLRLVRSGRRMDETVEVLSGLSGGEVVVVEDAHLLTDGMAVEVRP